MQSGGAVPRAAGCQGCEARQFLGDESAAQVGAWMGGLTLAHVSRGRPRTRSALPPCQQTCQQTRHPLTAPASFALLAGFGTDPLTRVHGARGARNGRHERRSNRSSASWGSLFRYSLGSDDSSDRLDRPLPPPRGRRPSATGVAYPGRSSTSTPFFSMIRQWRLR